MWDKASANTEQEMLQNRHLEVKRINRRNMYKLNVSHLYANACLIRVRTATEVSRIKASG